MPLLIIAGIIVLIIASVQYAKKVDEKSDNVHHLQNSIDTSSDSPIGFGYKCRWIAIKTDDQQRVAHVLGLMNPQKSNWKSGINHAYDSSIFISPSIDGWTLAVGWGLPAGDSKQSMEQVKVLIKKLSTEFEEAQFFSTHRIVEFHAWMKGTNGNIDRLYSYLGKSNENIEIVGEPTEIETSLNLFNTFSEAAKENGYFDRNDVTYPDEELLMNIAANWSIDPTTLDDRTGINGLGLVGRIRY
jgi:hypothetical protein